MDDPAPARTNGLRSEIGLFSATTIGLGAIIGAGIFVVTGIAAGVAGPALFVSILIAGLISLLSAFSYAELSEYLPVEGGTYAFARELISPLAGFLSGWIFVFTNIFTGAVLALGFARYLGVIFPAVPEKTVAVILCILFVFLNYFGVKKSAVANDLLVITKVFILLVFILIGLSVTNLANFTPLTPHGAPGILEGAALIFFAYTGFARVTVIAEEVRDPRRTIPRAVFLSLGMSIVIYLFVSLAAIGMAGAGALAGSGSPLTTAMQAAGNPSAILLVTAGGLVATASVLITTILGVSRVVFAMARNRELPGACAHIDSQYQTPSVAIFISGAAMIISVLLVNLAIAVAVSSFAYLLYYGIANFAAIRLGPSVRRYPRIISVLGLASCLALLPFLNPISWALGATAVISGIIVYHVMKRCAGRTAGTGSGCR
jgi:APA family basic amino acid/polyamine antiporter